jgi:hypothetical protein
MRGAIVLLFLTVSITAGAQKKTEKIVRERFAAFSKAMASDNHSEVVSMLDKGTLVYLNELKDKSIKADSATVAGLPVFERIIVFRMRHSEPVSDVLRMGQAEFFTFLCKYDILSKSRLESSEIESLKVNKTEVMVQTIHTVKGKQEKTAWRWTKQGKSWMLDLASSLKAATIQMEEAFSKGFLPANDRIFLQLEKTSGSPIRPSIWHPMTDY